MFPLLNKLNQDGRLFGCNQVLRNAQQEISPVHVAVLCMIYAPFCIIFVRCLRSSFRGFCYTLDVCLHLSMIPFKIILCLMHMPLNWCDAYSKWGGACPKPKRKCRPCGRSRGCRTNSCTQFDACSIYDFSDKLDKCAPDTFTDSDDDWE